MKHSILILTLAVLLCSCLKQSIPEAMQEEKYKTKFSATFGYKINGVPVALKVDYADYMYNQPYDKLAFRKGTGTYSLYAGAEEGGFNLALISDSMAVGPYLHSLYYMSVMTYKNVPHDIYGPSDKLNINITSYNKGHVSGSFSGLLTPVISFGPDVHGPPSSVAITEGYFNNVPVIY